MKLLVGERSLDSHHVPVVQLVEVESEVLKDDNDVLRDEVLGDDGLLQDDETPPDDDDGDDESDDFDEPDAEDGLVWLVSLVSVLPDDDTDDDSLTPSDDRLELAVDMDAVDETDVSVRDVVSDDSDRLNDDSDCDDDDETLVWLVADVWLVEELDTLVCDVLVLDDRDEELVGEDVAVLPDRVEQVE